MNPLIRPIQPADLPALAAAAAQDDHAVFSPSHLMLNAAGVPSGYFSVGQIDAVMFWSHTANAPRDSIALAQAAMAAARRARRRSLWPVTSASPFLKLMPAFGFNRLGAAEFFELES
jgi:hypothetical protein